VGTSSESGRILVRTHKYDGAEHRRWFAEVIKYESPLIVLDAQFDQDIQHDLLGTIASGTLSTEFYWLDRWYNVFRFSEPDRSLKSFYCNINMPPVFDGEILSYVDLDIDVLVEPDFSYRVLDLEDFEANAELYSYPADIRESAHRALDDLLKLVESRAFPFDVK